MSITIPIDIWAHVLRYLSDGVQLETASSAIHALHKLITCNACKRYNMSPRCICSCNRESNLIKLSRKIAYALNAEGIRRKDSISVLKRIEEEIVGMMEGSEEVFLNVYATMRRISRPLKRRCLNII